MFRKYGFLGIALIIFVEINFFLKIQPFANWYFPIVWIGYILTIDALVYKLRKRSMLSNKPYMFLGLFFLSALFWWTFEILNYTSVANWSYNIAGVASNPSQHLLAATISFATVLPALFETVELLRSVHLFDKRKLKHSHKITKGFLYGMMALGVFCFIVPFLLPEGAFPLIWLSFFLILDPINYMHRQPSIIKHLKDRRATIFLTLIVAGLILGFLWEFWNYWAAVKWTYQVPAAVGFWKIFEMPILGYLFYMPFALELYAMYWFVRSLFLKKEPLLIR